MPDAVMPVRIAKLADVVLANPVTFRVSPLTVEQALDMNVISSFPFENFRMPDRAGN